MLTEKRAKQCGSWFILPNQPLPSAGITEPTGAAVALGADSSCSPSCGHCPGDAFSGGDAVLGTHAH